MVVCSYGRGVQVLGRGGENRATATTAGVVCSCIGSSSKARRKSCVTRKRDRRRGRGRGREIERDGDRTCASNRLRCFAAGGRRRDESSRGGKDESTREVEVTEGESQSDTPLSLLLKPANRRRVTSCECAEDSLYELLEIGQSSGRERDPKGSEWEWKDETWKELVELSIEDGNPKLATDLFRVLCGGSKSRIPFKWSLDESEARTFLLIRLIRSLYVENALTFLEDSCKVSLQTRGADQISFGSVVSCPYCCGSAKGETGRERENDVPLAVVKPFEGAQTVPCASCRYQFDLYSGNIVSAKTEAPTFVPFFQRKIFGGGGQAGLAVHSFNVESPDGTARAYKFATATDEIPGKVGDRVTMIAASASKPSGLGLGGAPIPPGWKKGEARAVYNHRQGKTTSLLRAADPNSGIPLQYIALGSALLAGGDLASGLLNPDLPALIAAGTLGVSAAGAVTNQFVFPQLAKLPSGDLFVIECRQQFLGQYDVMKRKLDDLLASACEDIQLLSRLWNLHHKIEALGSNESYDARLQKILSSATILEDRIGAKVQLIEGYSRVSHMIEIEVELDADIDAAEARVAISDINEQMDRVRELEDLKEEWSIQVESKDEIEKLLSVNP